MNEPSPMLEENTFEDLQETIIIFNATSVSTVNCFTTSTTSSVLDFSSLAMANYPKDEEELAYELSESSHNDESSCSGRESVSTCSGSRSSSKSLDSFYAYTEDSHDKSLAQEAFYCHICKKGPYYKR